MMSMKRILHINDIEYSKIVRKEHKIYSSLSKLLHFKLTERSVSGA